ncbi:MAG: methyltransferase domain-containing protein [Candidatus Zambryskibacteria bacterium]|nr:methyltransferase domain-containing protein [Candidatus Zambryskibacteria bacterium]
MKYNKFINEKIAEIAKEKTVLDIGGGERFGKWLSTYKHLFKDCEYKTFDYDESTGADIVGDILSIPLGEESVDAVICNCVLEHVENPSVAIKELYRILRVGGKIFVHIPSIYPYHARAGHYLDYWRFFGDAVKLLFKDFSRVEVQKRGGYFKALSFFIPFQHKLRFLIDPTANFLDTLFKTENRTTTSGYYIYAIK